MTPKEYTEGVLRTKSPHFDPHNVPTDFLHAAMGIATESGELLDIAKRCIFYGKGSITPEQYQNALEEVGDLMWYMAMLCFSLGVSFEYVWTSNLAKLRARYPGKFTPDDALTRNLVKELNAMREAAEAAGINSKVSTMNCSEPNVQELPKDSPNA